MLTKLMDAGISIFESIFGIFIDAFSSFFTKICDLLKNENVTSISNFLKTDKNTLLGVIFSLLTLYLVVDRFVEVMLMIFTGIRNTLLVYSRNAYSYSYSIYSISLNYRI